MVTVTKVENPAVRPLRRVQFASQQNTLATGDNAAQVLRYELFGFDYTYTQHFNENTFGVSIPLVYFGFDAFIHASASLAHEITVTPSSLGIAYAFDVASITGPNNFTVQDSGGRVMAGFINTAVTWDTAYTILPGALTPGSESTGSKAGLYLDYNFGFGITNAVVGVDLWFDEFETDPFSIVPPALTPPGGPIALIEATPGNPFMLDSGPLTGSLSAPTLPTADRFGATQTTGTGLKSLTTSGESAAPYAQLSLDIAQFISSAFGARVDIIDGTYFKYTILAVKFGSDLKVGQTLTFTPTGIEVDIQTSIDAMISGTADGFTGEHLTGALGDTFTLDTPSFAEGIMKVDVSYRLHGTLTSEVEFAATAGVTIEAFAIELHNTNLKDFDIGVGPLVKVQIPEGGVPLGAVDAYSASRTVEMASGSDSFLFYYSYDSVASDLPDEYYLKTFQQGPDDPNTGVGADGTLFPKGVDGMDGDDKIYGNDFNNLLYGSGGSDTLYGYVGNDVLSGGQASDTLWGGEGDDGLLGGSGNDVLLGENGKDYLNGGTGSDELLGGLDDDRLSSWGLDGADVLDGGAGNDHAEVYRTSAFIGQTLDLNLPDSSGLRGPKWTLVDGTTLYSIETIEYRGGLGNDVITTKGSGNTVLGGGGNDILKSNGLDTMDGGAGDDIVDVPWMSGGTYRGGDGDQDKLVVTGPAAGVELDFKAILTGGTGLPGITQSGFERVGFVGGAGGDTISGSDRDDVLSGGDGDDWLVSNFGSDVLLGGSGNDVLTSTDAQFPLLYQLVNGRLRRITSPESDILDGGDGTDIAIIDRSSNGGKLEFTTGTDAKLSDGTRLISIEVIFYLGSSGKDEVRASSGSDNIKGGGGKDILDGAGGSDIVDGQGGNDRLILRAGEGGDSYDGGDGIDDLEADFTAAAAGFTFDGLLVENRVAGQITARNFERYQLIGSAFADVLLGGDEAADPATLPDSATVSDPAFRVAIADRLSGGAGDDYIDGRGGVDFLQGGAGNDILVWSDGDLLDGGLGIDIFKLVAPRLLAVSIDLRADSDDAIVVGGAHAYSIERLDVTGADTAMTVAGREYVDTIVGSSADDTLRGRGGDDVIDGGDGADLIYGGDGADRLTDLVGGTTIYGDDGADVIRIGAGLAYGGVGDDSITGVGGQAVLYGDAGDDTITGGASVDTLHGGDGDDTLDGGGGIDTVWGGAGADRIVDRPPFEFAQSGVYHGEAGDDFIEVFGGGTITGDAGDDAIHYFGAGTVSGGDGNDSIISESGPSSIDGGAGDDFVSVGSGIATVTGGVGDDTLLKRLSPQLAAYQPGTGIDTLSGGDGNDRIGSTVRATLDGGDGFDTLVVDQVDGNQGLGSGAAITLDFRTPGVGGSYLGDIAFANFERLEFYGSGQGDTVKVASGAHFLNGRGGFDIVEIDLSNVGAFSGATELVAGGAGGGFVVANFNSSIRVQNFEYIVLKLGGGNDDIDGRLAYQGQYSSLHVTAGSGDDSVRGSGGNDSFDGGEGIDTLVVSGLLIDYAISGGSGSFTVRDKVGNRDNTDTISSIERIRFADGSILDLTIDPEITGTPGNDRITPTENTAEGLFASGRDDRIMGLGGDDVLDGGEGADTLIGGKGDDTYYIDTDRDTVTELANEGFDTVYSEVTLILPANVEKAVLTANAVFANLTGGAGTQTLVGNDTANAIDGGAGSDVMQGKGGDDSYRVDDATDEVIEAVDAGYDTVVVTQLHTYVLPDNVEDLSFETVTAVQATGNAGANRITGTDGNDVLRGLSGDDVLDGGLGDDRIEGGAGNDIAYGGGGADIFKLSHARGAYTISFDGAGYTLVDTTPGGGDGTDMLYDIAKVEFADGLVALGGPMPAVAVDDSIETDENFAALGFLLMNDSDPDGPVATVAAVNGSAAAVGQMITLPSGAKLRVTVDGRVAYNPNHAFDGLAGVGSGATNTVGHDSFTYTLANGGTATVSVTINGVASAADNSFRGSAGNDIIDGSVSTVAAMFDLTAGGDDRATGGSGDDGFDFGATFTIADYVDGGAGANDQIGLRGNYAAGVTIGAAQFVRVEALVVLPGFDYSLTALDSLVGAGGVFTIFAGELGASDDLTFDGSRESDGGWRIYGGAGKDVVTGGSGNDGIYFGPGRFDPAVDVVDGGPGSEDQLALDGNYTLTLAGAAVKGIETVVLLPGTVADRSTYAITLADSFAPVGTVRTINAAQVVTALTLDGAGELDAVLQLYGGGARDTITGGAGADVIFGGGGGDRLIGGAGGDRFVYTAAANSTGSGYDTLVGFAPGSGDRIDLPGVVEAADARIVGGTLSLASFDLDLTAAVGVGQLSARHAVVFTPDAGGLAGITFLIVDANGQAGYQAGQDYVFALETPPAPADLTGIGYFL